MVLIFNVLFDHLIRDVAAAATEVAPRPEMASPILLAQMGKLRQQMVRCLPFQSLHQLTDGHLRRNRDEKMHMILRKSAFYDVDFLAATDFPQQFPYPVADFSVQHRFSIFCHPDQMQMDAKDIVSPTPIIAHADQYSMLKLPPKGGGFNPPMWRQ